MYVQPFRGVGRLIIMAVQYLVMEMFSGWSQLISVSVFVIILVISHICIKHARLPPGPYGLPFIGFPPFLSKSNLALFFER